MSRQETGTQFAQVHSAGPECRAAPVAVASECRRSDGSVIPWHAARENATYLTSELNQYDRVDVNGANKLRQGLRYDDDGNLVEQYVAADMNCDGTLNFGDINGDGTYPSFRDINPFVALLSGG